MWPHTTELIIVLAIVILLFGAGRIPKLAEDIGKSIKAFRKGFKEEEKTDVKEKTNVQENIDIQDKQEQKTEK